MSLYLGTMGPDLVAEAEVQIFAIWGVVGLRFVEMFGEHAVVVRGCV